MPAESQQMHTSRHYLVSSTLYHSFYLKNDGNLPVTQSSLYSNSLQNLVWVIIFGRKKIAHWWWRLMHNTSQIGETLFSPVSLKEHKFHKTHHSGSHFSTSSINCDAQKHFGAISDVRFSKITKNPQLVFSIPSIFLLQDSRGVLVTQGTLMAYHQPQVWWIPWAAWSPEVGVFPSKLFDLLMICSPTSNHEAVELTDTISWTAFGQGFYWRLHENSALRSSSSFG